MSSSVLSPSASRTAKPTTSVWLKRIKPAIWLVPFALFFYLFQLAPMIWVLFNSFIYDGEFAFDNYIEVLDSAFMLQAFGNSLWLSVWSSIFGLAIATLLVSSLRRVDSKLRDAVIAFTNMSSNFAGVPLSFAFIIILGTNGAITLLLKQYGLLGDFDLYGKWGLLAIYIYFQIPLAVLLLYPAFDALSDDWQAAAALLGARTSHYWAKVALPVLSPALFGTFIILIANAIGAYASVYALTSGNYNVITIRIASLVSGDLFLEPNLAAAISVILMALLAFITVINQWLIAKSYAAKKSRK
ncbi:TPA: ABC transporter permease subunit [Vibrio parahaemolyticus]|uniref:ABC transporter permease n=1 Tax=Vibrio parahaemolyticus TaxID=670 RepID=UPI00186A8B6F|nr:ABC transporter permease subunit [Vibrio parahaemolyticus]MBE3865250.1 ABC transporter permease subunit [Vibrio parahaemolyticus]MCZ5879083.1 ABC transporter permease subunit [Vibrio parahaemolyticus]MCZ6370215.1 ABC transporter permease subunit [Vibrio parahaemolyticus]MDG3045784.1 ABC transporter permease subunit [Vibrio parahaemolyticus]HBC3458110.1 ABC transporter permease subunit [Vibrio parahaemolyticus]